MEVKPSLDLKGLTKSTAHLHKKKSQKRLQKPDKENCPSPARPTLNLIRGTALEKAEMKRFLTLLYRGLAYASYNLKGPSAEFIKKKQRKFLLLDLDETLIHSVFTEEPTTVSFTHNKEQFRFNVRPHCAEFLEAMSEYYTVYVFTAGTQDYAEPIVEFLNQRRKVIHGVLHRANCMETHNGFFIKDLRIVLNRGLKDLVIVDNLVHSFGLQLTNGLPILEFLNSPHDKELLGLIDPLKQLHDVDDVRDHLRQRLQLERILDIPEADFINVDCATT